MQVKTIAIVEDEEPKRRYLGRALERRGFRVRAAGTVSEARRIIHEMGGETDVMVMDMRLDDPDEPSTTGADIAIEFHNQYPLWMPEYLITTAHSRDMNYYRLALHLGAAAYLLKEEIKQEDTIRHIRALALKRALRVERQPVMEALNSISESTKNLSEAVTKFCREMLMEELNACLGAPYILLLTDEQGTQNIATNTDLPTGYEASYAAVQSMAQTITKLSSFHVIADQDLEDLPIPLNVTDVKCVARLSGAALLPLANIMNFSLSLALLVPLPEESRHPEDTRALAAVLAQHVRPSIIEHFLSILIHLDSKKKAVLKSISYFCLYVGQEQQRIIDEGVAGRELQENTAVYESLKTMAGDLRQTGTILNSAANSLSKVFPPTLEMRDLIEREFEDLRDVIAPNQLVYKFEGSCRVKANEDISIAFKRLLHWMAQRYLETPPILKPGIHVQCIERGSDSLIIFEDRSKRLPKDLREQMFEPFSTSLMLATGEGDTGPGLYLPLYLAKILVEEKYSGRLTDESDSIIGDIGHRLLMRFSLPDDKLTTNGVRTTIEP